MLLLIQVIVGVLIFAYFAYNRYKKRRTVTVRDVMEAYAMDAVDSAKRGFQKDLDYSIASIAVLEEIVGRQHDAIGAGDVPTEEQLSTFAMTWGAYLGETIRKAHGGEWSRPVEGVYAGAYVLTVGETQLSPPGKIYKRLVDGEADNLVGYYRVIFEVPR